jgi:hypothetical protein
MFATEIVNLGSVFDCDWQGIPKISDLLIPTTYKIPQILKNLMRLIQLLRLVVWLNRF